jgi:flavin reductase (DIM6/NTAB) family NADH-FMN oxidoreductase RutF
MVQDLSNLPQKGAAMPFVPFKTGTLLAPTPVVLVGCAAPGAAPNLITVAWTGIICSDPPMLSISVRRERHSYGLIAASGQFTVNLVSRSLLKACDFCGVRSGREVDKFKACGLTALPAEGLDLAPCVAESPLYLSCWVDRQMDLGSHTLFLANIVHVGVQQELLEENGRLALERADLVAYSHGDYHLLGPREGFFGFSVARPEVLERRMAER